MFKEPGPFLFRLLHSPVGLEPLAGIGSHQTAFLPLKRGSRRVVHELPLVLAEKPGLAMLDQFSPAPAVIHDQETPAGHCLKPDTGQVLIGLRHLDDAVRMTIDFVNGQAAGRIRLDPVWFLADLAPDLVVYSQHYSFLEDRGDHRFVDPELCLVILARVFAGDTRKPELFLRAIVVVGKLVQVEVRSDLEPVEPLVDRLQFILNLFASMIGLVQEAVDQSPAVHLLFQVEQPRHTVHERGRPGVESDRLQVLQELAVAVGNDVHPFARPPVPRRMDDAAPVLHLHRPQIVIERPGVDQMDLQPQRLPDTDLMIQFRIRASQPGRVPDDAYLLDLHSVSQGAKLPMAHESHE
ncbi:MAG: hypothetical protein KatS3mg114_0838 [Planctomycetaceae bacterium]|nr:MAG: hypothetical protein KatS3mg114_0838 [Planctomycetaceae bacterium]